MFAFVDVFHFFAHKLAWLSRRGFAFALVFSRAFQCFLFWHIKTVSPLATSLDVEDCVEPQQPLLLRFNRGPLCAYWGRSSSQQIKTLLSRSEAG